MVAGKKKGSPKTGGRVAGQPNKATSDARASIALFVDGNAHRLNGWLDMVANGTDDVKPNPVKAFEMFQSLVEYHVPKLARAEVSGPDGGAIKLENVTITIIDPLRIGND